MYLSSEAAEKRARLVSRSTLTIEKWKAEQQLLQVQQFLSIDAMHIRAMCIGDESAKQPSAYETWPGSLTAHGKAPWLIA
jgi:hypothetical protein